MIYEYRVYTAAPGKMDALHHRFATVTLDLFERHGLKVIGFWVPEGKEDEELVYILAFDSEDRMKQLWSEFGADPEWQAARAESERDGALVTGVQSTIFYPTAYSPLK